MLDRVLDRMEVLERSKRRRRFGRFAISFLICAAIAAGIAAVFWRRFEEIHLTWPWRF